MKSGFPLLALLGLLGSGMTGSSMAGPRIAVVSRGDNNVKLLDVVNDRIRSKGKEISVGETPGEMCSSPNGRWLFVGELASKSVVVIDLATNSVTGKMSDPGMKRPDGCTVSPDSKKLYLMDLWANRVFVFSTETNKLLKEIDVDGVQPRRAIFTPDGKKIIVSLEKSNKLAVIDALTDKLIGSVKTGVAPRCLASTPDGKYIVACVIDDDSLEYFKADTLEMEQSVGVPRSPQVVRITPDGQLLFVLGHINSVLGVASLRPIGEERRIAITIPVGKYPVRMAMSPDGKYLYTTGDDGISVIDLLLMQVTNTVSAAAFGKPAHAEDIVYLK